MTIWTLCASFSSWFNARTSVRANGLLMRSGLAANPIVLRVLPKKGHLIIDMSYWVEHQNETNRPQSGGHLGSGFVFNPAFGKHRNWLKPRQIRSWKKNKFLLLFLGLNQCLCLLKAHFNTKRNETAPIFRPVEFVSGVHNCSCRLNSVPSKGGNHVH